MGVVVSVFFAFGSTGFAGFCTNLHKRLHKLRSPRRESAAKGTDVSAIAAEFNAGGHVVPLAVTVMHFQAGCCAGFAGFRAIKTSVGVGVSVLYRFHICR